MKQCDKCNKKTDLYLYYQSFGKPINESRFQQISKSKRRVIEKVDMLCQECLQKNSQKLPLYLKKQFQINLDNKFIDELKQKEVAIKDLSEQIENTSLQRNFEKFKVYDLDFKEKLEELIKEEFNIRLKKLIRHLKQNINQTGNQNQAKNQQDITKGSPKLKIETNQKSMNSSDDNSSKSQSGEVVGIYYQIIGQLTTIKFSDNQELSSDSSDS
ncbi:hypothetical protein OXYTRIMIC_761 [Oxytricha trifallax]|uniref:Uncharacterized protein n=1 Tax=Oxytricha trifallax TaxID=1172189 RepID=A0A073HZM4_9SPIT|nr:hypothetical protein OXYTRIMIC_761 [Oxytricha trifallax]